MQLMRAFTRFQLDFPMPVVGAAPPSGLRAAASYEQDVSQSHSHTPHAAQRPWQLPTHCLPWCNCVCLRLWHYSLFTAHSGAFAAHRWCYDGAATAHCARAHCCCTCCPPCCACCAFSSHLGEYSTGTASSLAARMKSALLIPPMACVDRSILLGGQGRGHEQG